MNFFNVFKYQNNTTIVHKNKLNLIIDCNYKDYKIDKIYNKMNYYIYYSNRASTVGQSIIRKIFKESFQNL